MESVAFDPRRLPADARMTMQRTADGWPLRVFDHRTPAPSSRGSILFLSGRADFIEKYLEPLADWRRAGFNVRSFDWRGQGLSGRLGRDAFAGHVESFDPWVDDLKSIAATWIAETPGPHYLIGQSMGGHLALRMLADGAPGIARAVLTSPMIGINLFPLPARLARWRTARQVAAGRAFDYADAQGPTLPPDSTRSPRLTSDTARYAVEGWWRQAEPGLAMGGVTWGWLAAAFASIDRLMTPGVLEKIEQPVLLLSSGRDRLIDVAAVQEAARCLPNARLQLFPNAGHELIRESDPIRDRVLAAIQAFLVP